MKAEIITGFKLSEEELQEIIKKFKFLKEFEVVNTVDPKIYGGIIIKYQGKVIDLSLSSRLKNFKKTMYEIN